MDAAIVRWLNSGVGEVPAFDFLMEVFVSDYLVPVFGSLVLLGLWFYGQSGQERLLNQLATITGTIAVGFSNLVIMLVQSAVTRPRPFQEHDLELLFYRPTDPSFPANAAGVGFALATAVFLRYRRMGLVLYGLAFLWGFARVYAGVHYPTDILAGAAIGVVVTLGSYAVVRLAARPLRLILAVARRAYLA